MSGTLQVGSSPHVRSGHAVDKIMWNVFAALVPVAVFAVIAFGWAALITLVAAVLACVGTEHAFCKLGGKPSTVGDGSVAITGLLYGLTLPPHLPVWMTVLGGVVGVGMAKVLFGGLGYNAFNPALVARAFLQAAFPAALTTWMPGFAEGRWSSLPSSVLTMPFCTPAYDGVAAATPLALAKFDGVFTATRELAFGLTSGSAGETCGWLILAGGTYLAARRMLEWRIPVSILATVAAWAAIMHAVAPDRYPGAGFMLFSGGLMLGAVFMATDMVASPMTSLGCVVYGLLIGVLVVVIRVWGGMPEGVMYAILLANALSPHIDTWIRPTVYGTTGREKRA